MDPSSDLFGKNMRAILEKHEVTVYNCVMGVRGTL